MSSYFLYEYDRGVKYSPASEEDVAAYTKALQNGTPYILKGHHGFSMKFTVRSERSPDSERELFGVNSAKVAPVETALFGGLPKVSGDRPEI